MGNTTAKIDKSVDEFIQTIKKAPCYEYFTSASNTIDWNNTEVYENALYQGYLDACRTIHWSTGATPAGEALSDKKQPLTKLAGELRDYFIYDKASFDAKYPEWCEDLRKSYDTYLTDGITYGQAQKIINMAFKYLYCIYHKCEKREEYKKRFAKKFDDCHMPLDSFSLEWFKRMFGKDDFSDPKSYSEDADKLPPNLFTKRGGIKIKADSIGSWSSMETWKKDYTGQKYPYEFYAHVIRKYCDKNDISPLQLDFLVWSKMQKIMAAEAFIKAFNDEKDEIDTKPEDYEINELDETLRKRLDKIRPLI